MRHHSLAGRAFARAIALSVSVLTVAASVTVVSPAPAAAAVSFSITGRGWGHGIGLSQYGAHGLADHGYSFSSILRYYYQGTHLGPVTSAPVQVNLDSGASARSNWILRSGTTGGKIVVAGAPVTTDIAYEFRPSGTSGIAMYTVGGKTALHTYGSSLVVEPARADGVLPGQYEEDYSAIHWDAGWVREPSAAQPPSTLDSGGYYKYFPGGTVTSSSASLSFNGTSIAVIGRKGPTCGKFSVSIDGGAAQTVDTSATPAYQQKLFERTGLLSGQHTLKITVSRVPNKVVVLDRFDVGGTPAPTTGTPLLWIVSGKVGTVDAGVGPYGRANMRFRGTMKIVRSGTGLKLINVLPMEEYLYGVVPRESPSSWPAEALKAQAVAARSYAYMQTKGNKILYCTTMSQMYGGHSALLDGVWNVYEAASTNQAVNATRGLMVLRPDNSVVTTFFFSSSGGHTANNEDVWKGTPDPALRGVPDPYEVEAGSALAASWGAPIVYDGAALASKMGLSSPVVAITTTNAASGHVRYVNYTLANGVKGSKWGNTFRGNLGLRSTMFQINAPTIDIDTGRVEDTSPRITYSGKWADADSSAFSGGSYHYTTTAGSTAAITAYTTKIAIVGPWGPSYGQAEVWIDGVRAGIVDAYAPTYGYNKVLFSLTGYALRQHTITLKATGLKNPLSSGSTFVLDAFDFSGAPADKRPVPPTPTPSPVIENDAAGVTFGRFINGSSAAYSGGTYTYSYSKAPYTGSRLEARFKGSTIHWIGPKQPGYGRAKVFIDGVYKATVDCYSATPVTSATLWQSPVLTDAAHVISIEMDSGKNPASTGYVVVVDKFEVGGATPSGIGARANETAGSLKGTWIKVGGNPTYTNSTYVYSYWPPAAFRYTFTGTRIAWIGPKVMNYGKAAIYIDGAYKGTVSQYAPATATAFRARVWESAVLPKGTHTLEIRPLGTRDAASAGANIVVDALDYQQ